jgi:hypothetical protein
MKIKTKIRISIIILMKTGFFSSLFYETITSSQLLQLKDFKFTFVFLTAILFEFLYYNCKKIILKSQ